MTDPRARLNAALEGRYRIERELGAGGMATVYLAQDLKHDRKVALKVLKPELTAVLGGDRFIQEIKTTASLQHPHILPLFDSGSADGFLFYVMPYIEGESLRDKLDRETQLGIDEAVRITREVADALDYAHRHGIIHRDIKPENILLHDGRPMVADFGIALAVSAAAGGRMTETGTSVGTPRYMSPEQATADREITGRADQYSLASVTYEMLTGEPPHSAATAQAVIMKIIADTPRPVTELRKSAPQNVAAAVMKALEKLPADRFESAAKFSEALADPSYGAAEARAAGSGGPGSVWNRATLTLAGLSAVLAIIAVWSLAARPSATPPQVFRATIELPPNVEIAPAGSGSRVAISPDGSRIVFAGGALGAATPERRLFMRTRDRLDVVPLPNTEGAHGPFFSPDGSRLGFFTVDPDLVRWITLDGGSPVTVVQEQIDPLFARGVASGGAIWGLDGGIYTRSLDGVIRIPENGGPSRLVSQSDGTANENGHTPTDALPNGRGLIITVHHSPTTMRARYDVAALDLETGRHSILVRGVYGRYVAPGYLVFARADGTLAAAPFDQDRLELTGPAVTLIGETESGGRVEDFAIGSDGSLLYAVLAPPDAREIVWVGRDGTITPFDPSWRAHFETVVLSQDGSRLAAGVFTSDGGAEVWIAQIQAGTHARLATEGEVNYRPTWHPDGRVAYRTLNPQTGLFDVVAKRADGLGSTELLMSADRSISTGLVSRDGRWRIYRTDATEGGRGDIFGLQEGDTIPRPLVATDAEERHPALSPNGRWLAYRSDIGGTDDVWVSAFPDVGEGRWQVSLVGGSEPVWSRSGRELFYLTPDNELVAATVPTEPPFDVLERKVLFTRPPTMRPNLSAATYDVDVDDSRFLMIRSLRPGGPDSRTATASGASLLFVENWVEELKARVSR